MKTLVIHPFDRTTDFLRPIYIDIPNVHVIRKFGYKPLEAEIVADYDRVIMLGHGSEMGLFNTENYSFVIDDDLIDVLKDKELIAIWCNADVFMEENNLKGIYTGMMISEMEEAKQYLSTDDFTKLTKEDLEKSNNTFALAMKEIVSKYGSGLVNEAYQNDFMEDVNKLYPPINPLTTFNNSRIYNNTL